MFPSAYELGFDQRGTTLVARMRGRRPGDDDAAAQMAAAAWVEIARETRERGVAALMAVADIEGAATSGTALRLAAMMEHFGFPRELRIALVFSEPASYRINRLGTLVAAERGWLIDAFTTEADGLRWLASGDPVQPPSEQERQDRRRSGATGSG